MRLVGLLLATVAIGATENSWITPSNQGENRNVIVEMIKWKVRSNLITFDDPFVCYIYV